MKAAHPCNLATPPRAEPAPGFGACPRGSVGDTGESGPHSQDCRRGPPVGGADGERCASMPTAQSTGRPVPGMQPTAFPARTPGCAPPTHFRRLETVVSGAKTVVFVRETVVFVRESVVFVRESVVFVRKSVVFVRKSVVFVRESVVFVPDPPELSRILPSPSQRRSSFSGRRPTLSQRRPSLRHFQPSLRHPKGHPLRKTAVFREKKPFSIH